MQTEPTALSLRSDSSGVFTMTDPGVHDGRNTHFVFYAYAPNWCGEHPRNDDENAGEGGGITSVGDRADGFSPGAPPARYARPTRGRGKH